MIRRPPRSTLSSSSAASDVYKRQIIRRQKLEITAELVKTLRNKTDAGMMDCKKALKETGGDLEAAVAYLRQKGLAVASKRADRTTSEGAVWAAIAPDQKSGLLLEVNCETDFVAKTPAFVELGSRLTEHLAAVALES